MKAEIHPEYRFVVFKDIINSDKFITRSCVETRDVIELDAKDAEAFGVEPGEYPLINMDISAFTHPFYTGTQKIMDTEGRVDRFYKKFGFKQKTDES